MRGKFLAASLVVLVTGSSIGCKTTSNMAWWKSAGKDAKEAEVLARSAPELPSEIAKQAEGVVGGTADQLVGGQAAPFVPSATTPATTVAAATPPAAYPSTDAPSYTPPQTPQVASVPAAPASPNLGSIAMPYNPNAVPPATTKAVPEAEVAVDRYASVTPTTTETPAPPVSAYPSTTPRYAQQVAAAPTTEVTPSVTPATAASEVTASLGDRYAQATASVPTAEVPVENSLASEPAATETPAAMQENPVVAQAQPYRPGGTSTYPATADSTSPVQVATRPETPTTESTNTTSPYGGSVPATPAAPQVPRYR